MTVASPAASAGEVCIHIHVMRASVAILSLLFALVVLGWLFARFVIESRAWWVELAGDLLPLIFGMLLVLAAVSTFLRSWWIVGILSPLLLVGGILFGPYHWSGSKRLASGPTVNLVSFNVECHNRQMRSVEDWLRQIRADIVLLQELPKGYAGEQIDNLVGAYPYQIHEPANFRECTNMILSRHPLSDAEYFRLGDPSAPAYWLQHANVVISGKRLALYNAHLDKPIAGVPVRLDSARKAGSAVLRYDPDRRNRQIERLLNIVRAEELPYLVAGDFNMTEYSTMHSEMARSMQDAFLSAGTGFGATWPARAWSPLLAWVPTLLRIDYIWLGESLRPLEADVGPRIGSDHLPVCVKLEWRAPA